MPQLALALLLNFTGLGLAAVTKSPAPIVLVFLGALAALWGTEMAHPSSKAK
jgi:4-amino-4-deoxy-L-arabinose transferase-like glycosyltransferase